jgi:tRNA pseudouridine32 synthase/23S rRNA pseudouridine746 synthase
LLRSDNRGMCQDDIAIEYADSHLIVCVKPAGLLSVPGRGPDKQDCLVARVLKRYPDAMVVHRLDMATSGLMLLARGTEMQRLLSMAFEARQVHKRYTAVVYGCMAASVDAWHQIDLPLITDWPNRPRQKVCREHGKASLTRYRVLEHQPQSGRSRLELEPVTGRTHQLRVHLMSIGHAIVGDALYATPADVQPQDLTPRLLLHASEIALRHPASGQALRFTSQAPF